MKEELKEFEKKVSHSQIEIDRVDRLEDQVKTIAARPEVTTERSSTSSDFQINDLVQSNRMMLLRLSALEETNERLVRKIVELERK
ncbi:hypothetical protein SBOR_0470 [Sclerotinia borealis F-4128]|uniref:Uncharacterized protein n=1 Tax=Sclerotinia borealis (strain F-4128) TaxID=1432307 RepID=W9CWX4_SCLBF|nr:hypothetical protein SBOR_0470 [Sclerotinia borealis F-4128]